MVPVRKLAVLSVFVWPSLVLAAQSIQSLDVAPPAELEHGESRFDLTPNWQLAVGDTLRTGYNGRAQLQLTDSGNRSLLTLGANSELLLHSAEPAAQGHGAILRTKLPRGALRVDASDTQGLPQDFRVNVGRVRLRIVGADVWVAVQSSGETVCLYQGAVDMQIEGMAAEQFDQPGHCLYLTGASRRLTVAPAPDTLTAEMPPTGYAPAQAIPSAAESITTPAPAPSSIPAPGGWTVVIASLRDRPAAEAKAKTLRDQGLPAEVRPQPELQLYRVTLGHYADSKEARAEQHKLKGRFPGAWVLHE